MEIFIVIVVVIWFFWNTAKNWDGTRTRLDKEYKQTRFFIIIGALVLMFLIYSIWWVIDAGLAYADITWGGLISFLVLAGAIFAKFFQKK